MAVEHGLASLARTIAATPRAPAPTFEWATVVAGTGEVHVVLDSDDAAAPRPVSDNAAGPVEVGQRVMVVHHGHRLTIISAPAAPVDVPDTGWLNLTPATGYTATNAQWRVRDGWAMMRGQITAPEQWPESSYAVCATVPVEARPAVPMVATASDNGGRILGVALGSELSVINRLHSITPASTIRLDSIPPWRVD